MKTKKAWLVLLLLLSPSLGAAEQGTAPPVVEGQSIDVGVAMLVLDVLSVDDVNQRFEAIVIVRLSWVDPRLRGQSDEIRTFDVDEIWVPRYQISNEVFARQRFRDFVQVDPEGGVVYMQRLSGTFTSRLDLRRFPFDRQTLQLRLTFPDFEPGRLTPVPDRQVSGILPEFTLTDWSVLGWDIQSDPVRVVKNISRASVLFSFDTQRRSGFYIWKVIVPLAFIVFMSWAVFWISPENAGSQIGIATSAILTLIAYRFVLANLLPRVPYLTMLDYFTLGATVLVFLALVEVVITSGLSHKGKGEQALRVDRWARLVFPSSFAFMALAIFGH